MKLGQSPKDLLQPGRSLLSIQYAEVAPGMEGSGGYSFGKRKEYLVCVMSDIIIFARPNKGLFGNRKSSNDSITEKRNNINTDNESNTHHVKMTARLTDIHVTETYAVTQPKGESGFELRILGKIDAKDMQQGISPYQVYAIWCTSVEQKNAFANCIRDALAAKLAAFFSRKKVTPVPK